MDSNINRLRKPNMESADAEKPDECNMNSTVHKDHRFYPAPKTGSTPILTSPSETGFYQMGRVSNNETLYSSNGDISLSGTGRPSPFRSLAMASPFPPPPSAAAPKKSATLLPLPELSGRRVAFTTPNNYSPRLFRLLELRGALPLPIPTVVVEPTPSTLGALAAYLHSKDGTEPPLESFSALAFTSRTGISAFSQALARVSMPPLSTSGGPPFTVSALGKDAELLDASFLASLCSSDPSRVRVLVPEVASPAGMAVALGDGEGNKKVLCPVPLVVELEEPAVVPDFIRLLESKNWVAVRVPAYETRWAGPRCADGLVGLGEELDAVVFTSTAEVEGLLKGLAVVGWDWGMVRTKWPRMVAAAHGPVTADGAERLGVTVDVVGEKFGSFDGVLEALAGKWRRRMAG